ncbi:uncharacterized protein V1510DRAFT_409134 [Dipodascopsis tothii]|uniref:uncharacterized protein n=1 Tax=Dipodascopsis tothii TaxID=44089 RepID=UPI0034CDA29D
MVFGKSATRPRLLAVGAGLAIVQVALMLATFLGGLGQARAPGRLSVFTLNSRFAVGGSESKGYIYDVGVWSYCSRQAQESVAEAKCHRPELFFWFDTAAVLDAQYSGWSSYDAKAVPEVFGRYARVTTQIAFGLMAAASLAACLGALAQTATYLRVRSMAPLYARYWQVIIARWPSWPSIMAAVQISGTVMATLAAVVLTASLRRLRGAFAHYDDNWTDIVDIHHCFTGMLWAVAAVGVVGTAVSVHLARQTPFAGAAHDYEAVLSSKEQESEDEVRQNLVSHAA